MCVNLWVRIAPVAGAMGFGLPAAIAAKALYTDRTVICFAGDGCFLMTSQELATAVQERVGVIIVVLNNNSYGTIRSQQEREFPGHRIGTDLVNPDFVDFARSFGARAERVTTVEEFEMVLRRHGADTLPTVVEVRLEAPMRLA